MGYMPGQISANWYNQTMQEVDQREANAYNNSRIEKQDAIVNNKYQRDQAAELAQMAVDAMSEAMSGPEDQREIKRQNINAFLQDGFGEIGLSYDPNVHLPMVEGRARQLLSGSDMPSNIREWEYYQNNIPADQRPDYLDMKRSGNPFDLGGGGKGYRSAGGEQEVIVSPSDAIAREAALAKAKGLATGQAGIDVAAQDPMALANLEKVELENEGRTQEAEIAQKQRKIAESQKNTVLDLARSLREKNLSRAYGTFESKLPTLRQDTADVEVDVDRLSDLLTLENLGLMKGVLTDRDVQILRGAATSIANFKQGDKKAKDELDRIITTLEIAFGRAEKSAPSQKAESSTVDDLVKKYGG